MNYDKSIEFLSDLVLDIYPESLWKKFYLQQLAIFLSKRNPFYQYGKGEHFVNDEPGQRAFLSAYIDKRLIKDKKIGFIGNIEGEDYVALSRLMHQSEEWLRDRGVKKIIGPVSLSIWHRYRFFIK